MPDWLNVVDRRVRVRSKHAAAHLDADDPRIARIAAGVLQHCQDDAWFHNTRAFAELSLALCGGAALAGPVETLFMRLYLIATALHAVHLGAGLLLVLGLAFRLRRGLPLPGRAVTVETSGLYWHLVDLVWVFLYPVLYLAR